MFNLVNEVVRSLDHPAILNRVFRQVDLIPGIVLQSIFHPRVVVPDDPVVRVRVEVPVVHPKEVSAFMLRSLAEVRVKGRLRLPRPVKREHIRSAVPLAFEID